MPNLRELLDTATPGGWRDGGPSKRGHLVVWEPPWDGYNIVARCMEYARASDARLIALAPDLASLVIDMADGLRAIRDDGYDFDRTCYQSHRVIYLLYDLLARVEALGRDDG